MVIVEYNDEWPIWFDKIRNELCKNLNSIISVEHIGSTSIKGMCAKPIIDIDIVINNENNFSKTKEELELIGYYHNGNQGIIGREAFNRNGKNHKILDTIQHHLYVCANDNDELKRHVLFRNYLNKNNNIMIEYYNIKKEIIKKYGNEEKEKYVSVKEEEYKWFFEKVIRLAKLENEKQ
jgi:GrpB-like predicted nucleotidyltransferase (UPF0157 family)